MRSPNIDRNPFQELADRWECPFVARSAVEQFSGGMLHPRTMANLDSKGEGPEGKINMGRIVGYRTDGLVEWMWKRARCA